MTEALPSGATRALDTDSNFWRRTRFSQESDGVVARNLARCAVCGVGKSSTHPTIRRETLDHEGELVVSGA